jgi:hypothetical protein
MLNKSEHEYRGWKIKVSRVDAMSSPLVQVCRPGQDPREGGDIVVPFFKSAASWLDAEAAALQRAKKWIDKEDPPKRK